MKIFVYILGAILLFLAGVGAGCYICDSADKQEINELKGQILFKDRTVDSLNLRIRQLECAPVRISTDHYENIYYQILNNKLKVENEHLIELNKNHCRILRECDKKITKYNKAVRILLKGAKVSCEVESLYADCGLHHPCLNIPTYTFEKDNITVEDYKLIMEVAKEIGVYK